LETLDPKAKVEGPSLSPRESPPPSPKEDQPQPPERKIELCTPDIIDLPIINLQDAGTPFKIEVSTICITIARGLERFNEYNEPDSLSGISVYLRGGWRRWR
jgi:hypothetical protein